MRRKSFYKDLLFGVAVGDALGVPAEFKSRKEIAENPVIDMEGYGSHNQPAGTWSDDSSLTFCLAEALTNECDLESISTNFSKWLYENYWTPRGEVFDVGGTTRQAIKKIADGVEPVLCGGETSDSNGNGSLMRIAPLVFFLMDKPIQKRFEITRQVSSITHRHIRSIIACFYYLEFAREIIEKKDKFKIYKTLQEKIPPFLQSLFIDSEEIALFDRLLKGNIDELPEEKIKSSGYVLDTLEASIWCILTTNNYKEAVLKAVNLGEDTDTTAAVTGGLAGLLYGFSSIPSPWKSSIARYDDIEELAERMESQMKVFVK